MTTIYTYNYDHNIYIQLFHLGWRTLLKCNQTNHACLHTTMSLLLSEELRTMHNHNMNISILFMLLAEEKAVYTHYNWDYECNIFILFITKRVKTRQKQYEYKYITI